MGKYSGGDYYVTQFFTEEHEPRQQYEKIRSHVTVDKAAEVFNFYTTNVAAKTGITKRVIITDGDDYIVLEWRYGKGIVFGLDEPLS